MTVNETFHGVFCERHRTQPGKTYPIYQVSVMVRLSRVDELTPSIMFERVRSRQWLEEHQVLIACAVQCLPLGLLVRGWSSLRRCQPERPCSVVNLFSFATDGRDLDLHVGERGFFGDCYFTALHRVYHHTTINLRKFSQAGRISDWRLLPSSQMQCSSPELDMPARYSDSNGDFDNRETCGRSPPRL